MLPEVTQLIKQQSQNSSSSLSHPKSHEFSLFFKCTIILGELCWVTLRLLTLINTKVLFAAPRLSLVAACGLSYITASGFLVP